MNGIPNGLRPHHGILALLAALALHAAVFMRVPVAPQAGADAAGDAGIVVSLSMAASQAGSEADVTKPPASTPPAADQPPVAETEQIVTPVETAAVPVSAEVTTAPPAETAIPVSAPAARPEKPMEAAVVTPDPPIKTTPDPPVAVAAVDVPIPLPPMPRPATRKPVPPPQAIRVPPKVKAVQPAARSAAASQPRESIPEPRLAPNAAVAGTAKLDSQQHAPAASADSGQLQKAPVRQGSDLASLPGGGAVGNPSRDYMSQLRYWLDRNKTYPKDARRKRMQGVVHLYFRVTRDGTVLDYSIRKSAGHALLDAEAVAMLERAHPLPKFSKEMRGGYLDVTVPVEFSLRGNR